MVCRFALCFLMPSPTFKGEWGVRGLAEAVRHEQEVWFASDRQIWWRAVQTECVTDAQYRRWSRGFGFTIWNGLDLPGIMEERPSLLAKAFELAGDMIDLREMAKKLKLSFAELNGILTTQGVPGDFLAGLGGAPLNGARVINFAEASLKLAGSRDF